MNVKTVTISALFLVSVSLFAQENGSNETIKYSNITEFGFYAVSPRGISFEATTVNGFSMDKHHHFGLGFGMGYNFFLSYEYPTAYMPAFVNYRYYFTPDKRFSPQINASLGGAMVEDGGGIYSSLTMGFKAKKFSFSSGLSLMALYRHETWSDWIDNGYYDSDLDRWIEDPDAHSISHESKKWYFPFGFVLKVGFAF